jgi:hypothetical protein
MLTFILIGPHVRLLSDGNQTVSNVKKINHVLPLWPKQRERCLFLRIKQFLVHQENRRGYHDARVAWR